MHSSENTNFFAAQAADQLLAGISTKGRRELMRLKKPILLEPGAFLVHSGEKPGRIFVHRHGVIQTISPRQTDNPQDSVEKDEERVYGLAEALSGAMFDFSVRSVTHSEFDVIEKEDLFNFLRHQPELIQQLNIAFSSLYREAICRIKVSEKNH